MAALLAQTAPAPKTPVKTAVPKTAPKTAAPKTPVKTAPKTAVKTAAPKTSPTTMTDDEKTLYALGLSIHRSLAQFQLNAAEVEVVKRALSDATAGKPAVEINEWGPKIQGFAQARQAKAMEAEKAAAGAFLAKAAAEPGAVKTASGLIYRPIKPGLGANPKSSDTVKVHYRGTLTNGTEFDSSYKRNEPATFPLTGVVPCWTEGVQLMKVGEKATLTCPSNLAYGDRGQGPIPGGATLIFEIELLDIVTAKP